MSKPITILFGTETGNSEDCAYDLGKSLKAAGVAYNVVDMDDYDHDDLNHEMLLLIITSTFGNGDPPANAEALMEHLRDDSPTLDGTPFAVCALGDSSYPRFAQCGKDFDQLLGDCGGKRVFDRIDCDEDFEVPFDTFKSNVLDYVRANPEIFGAAKAAAAAAPKAQPAASNGGGGLLGKISSWFSGKKSEPAAKPAPAPAPTPKPAAPKAIDRDNPFAAKLLSKRLLSGEGSTKETRHYEIDLTGSSITYQPGDSFGVLPWNCPGEVGSILEGLSIDPEAQVTYNGKARSVRSVLTKDLCLQRLPVDLIKAFGANDGPAKAALDGGTEPLKAYIAGHHLIDLVNQHPGVTLEAQQLVDLLRGLAPRLYSIASSPATHPNAVHFTIETTRYEWNGRSVKGVASCWLADRVETGGPIPLYLHETPDFRLPEEGNTPILMIGPGTGVAPFRAFMQHRIATGAAGDNWLFFGHRNQASDFLYGDELQAWADEGKLKLTCAWSRDGDAKVYVQHKLAEAGDEVWAWLERGAHIYICGDAEGMAPAVHQALQDIAEAHGVGDTAAWILDLEKQGRYARDVY